MLHPTQDPWTLSRVSFQTERIQSETAPQILDGKKNKSNAGVCAQI